MTMNKTKIIATLGTVSQDYDVIRNIVDAGVRVFRLNFSHGTHDDKKNIIKIIRQIEAETDIYLSILGDLQGPKLRIGKINNVTLLKGESVRLIHGHESYEPGVIPIPHHEVFDILHKGQEVCLNDGFVKLRITDITSDHIKATILIGGAISSNKGINIPNHYIPIPALTEQDKNDVAFALEHDVDWIGLSFVQNVEDILQLRALIGNKARLLSKIEKPNAIKNIDAIIEHSDAIMVARGDLGIEIPLHQLPAMQKTIIKKCRAQNTPVIVATEMLESMIKNPRPTRAEVNDVASAIYDGTDCVMLSAETAIGNYPIEAISIMRDIILATEQSATYLDRRQSIPLDVASSEDNNVIAQSAVDIAERLACKAIITFTQTGATSIRAASTRSLLPILSLTPMVKTARAMALIWGVYSIKTRDDLHSFEDMVGKATRLSRTHGFTQNGDRITVTAGVPFGTPGKTNIIRVCTVGHHDKKNSK